MPPPGTRFCEDWPYLVPPERHPQWYFEDEDTIIIVSFELPSFHFRIHRAMLILDGRLDAAQPPIDHEGDHILTFEGMEVRELQYSVRRVDALIRGVYEPSAPMDLPRFHPDNATTIVEYMNIACRHRLRPLYETCLRQVENVWPTTLKDWDTNEARIADHVKECLRRRDTRPLDQYLPEPASALMFALTYGLPSIIPAAIATLARIPRHRGWVPQVSAQPSSALSDPRFRGARWEMLSQSAWRAFHNGCYSLRMEIADTRNLLSPYTDSAASDCLQPDLCARSRGALSIALDQLEGASNAVTALPTLFRPGPPPFPEPYRDAFTALPTLFNRSRLAAAGLCLNCQTYLSHRAEQRREQLWNALKRLGSDNH